LKFDGAIEGKTPGTAFGDPKEFLEIGGSLEVPEALLLASESHFADSEFDIALGV
jgi:hypothetical protein